VSMPSANRMRVTSGRGMQAAGRAKSGLVERGPPVRQPRWGPGLWLNVTSAITCAPNCAAHLHLVRPSMSSKVHSGRSMITIKADELGITVNEDANAFVFLWNVSAKSPVRVTLHFGKSAIVEVAQIGRNH
jgi:hypothetical protein